MEDSFEFDDFEVENLHASNNNVEKLEAPSSGMSFETIEEARKYYEDYGRQNGFWIRTRTSYKGQNRSNDVTSVLFVCAKEGMYVPKAEKDGVEENDDRAEDDKVLLNKRKRSCSTAKCGCKAHLRIKRDKWSMKWEVTVFDNAHNHQLVTPSKRMKMKSNRHMPKAVKDLTEPSHILISDPNISQTKGRKKDTMGKSASIQFGRLKSGIEMALNKNKRKCNLCNKLGHDRRTCPQNPMSKTYQDIHTGQELEKEAGAWA